MTKIDLDVGSQLTIDLKSRLNKIKASYVGMAHGEYLIIKIDTLHAPQNIHSSLHKGYPLTIRYLSKGKVYGFHTAILHVIFNPDKLIFIDYPNKIEEQNIRSQKRVTCSFNSKVSFEDIEFKGIIVDISKNGCKFTTIADEKSDNELIGKNLNDFAIKCSLTPEKIKLGMKLPGSKNEISITCKQRNLSKDTNYATLGLEFTSMSEEDSIILYDYLLDMSALPISYNFQLGIIKHKLWMIDFKAYLYDNKKISKKELTSSSESALGKWLYAEGIQMYKHIEGMIQLENTNEALHKFVLDFVKESPEKYSNEQKQDLISRIDKISQEIIVLLNNIEAQVD
jgi:c-di-GMP-binding flagellar brake protein YcgR